MDHDARIDSYSHSSFSDGANRAAIQCPGVDIMAQSSFVDDEGPALAAATGTCPELTSKGGHCLTHSDVPGIARLTGTRLPVDTDSHRRHDLAGQADVGTGLGQDEVDVALVTHSRELLATAFER